MAQDNITSGKTDSTSGDILDVISADGQEVIKLPDLSFVNEVEIMRNGQDLVLEGPDGTIIIIESYFNADPVPLLQEPGGAALTPDLVNSFVTNTGPVYLADAGTLTDESPVGSVLEVNGRATVKHVNGMTEEITIGTPIYQGDVVETEGDSAVHIEFIDETTFSISQNAKLAIDEYVFDPETESGASDFSMLRGLFVFTSGLIGRDDPDDVEIDTPMGSIGIRGTTIAGNTYTGEITVLEGAIVLRGLNGEEITLTTQMETAVFEPLTGGVTYEGVMDTDIFIETYDSLKYVSPSLFSALPDDGQDDPADYDSSSGNPESGSTTNDTNTAPPATEQNTGDGAALQIPTDDATILTATAETISTEPSAGTASDSGASPDTSSEPVSTDTAINTTTETADTTPGTTLSDSTTYADTTSTFDGTTDTTFNTTTQDPVSTTSDTSTTSGTTSTSSSSTGGSATTTTTNTTSDTTQLAPPPSGTTAPPPPPSTTLDLLTLGGANGFSAASGSHAGLAVAALGDIDNDGRIDFGYLGKSGGNQVTLQTVSGGSFALTTENLDLIMPEEAELRSLGDIDGDGFDDVIMGARNSDSASSSASGNVTIRSYGDPNSVGGVADDFVQLTGAGVQTLDGYGTAVAGPGDVNGDGLNDILFTAPQEGASAGSAYLFFGGTGFFSGGNIDPASADLVINGVNAGDLFGISASAAGDFDGDGLADFIIGAEGGNGGAGEAYIMFGQSSAWAVNLGAAAGAGNEYLKITGSLLGTNDKLGTEVFGGFDSNGDGFDDVAVVNENTVTGDSQLYFIYGGLGFGSFDVNTINGVNGFSVSDTGSTMKLVSGGSVGDFNGDGFDDFAIVTSDGMMNDIYVLYGGDDLVARHGADITISELESDTSLQDVAFHMTWDGFNGETIEITGAGDQNGDGFDDIVIGSMIGDSGTGDVLLIFGKPRDIDLDAANPDMHASGFNGPANLVASSNGDALVGDAGANILSNNNGGTIYTDISFRAGDGNDLIQLFGSNNARHIDGGAGLDELSLLGASAVLDLSSAGSPEIENIEKLSFNNVNQTINIGIDDIFSLLQDSQEIENIGSNYKTFKIADLSGAATGTTLNIEDNGTTPFFTPGAPDTTYNDGSSTFDVYFHAGGYALLIDQNIDAVNIV